MARKSTVQSYDKFLLSNVKEPKISPFLARLMYFYIGSVEEGGELAGVLKRVARDGSGNLTPEDRKAALKEIGDRIWYLGQLARMLDSTLEEVLKMNMRKLKNRIKRKTLSGRGDNR